MLQQNGTLSVWKFQPPPLYHGGGISLHVTLSVNWSDIIQICEKIKKLKNIHYSSQVFALWKTPALYPLGVLVIKNNAMETNAELRYGRSIITILLRSNISGCYTTLFLR